MAYIIKVRDKFVCAKGYTEEGCDRVIVPERRGALRIDLAELNEHGYLMNILSDIKSTRYYYEDVSIHDDETDEQLVINLWSLWAKAK